MNLPDDHISAELVLPIAAARAFVSGNHEVNFIEEFDTAIDVAQAEVTRTQQAKYVVVRVTP